MAVMIEHMDNCGNWVGLDAPILVVEDSLEDYEVIRRNFRKGGMRNPLYHCCDGDKAFDYLFHRGEFADPDKAPHPTLILLDLNMPGTDGYEVLAAVKGDLMLRQIPVLVVTSSSDKRDIEKCLDAGADGYILKPVTRSGLLDAIERLSGFLFQVVIVPKG